MYLIYRYIKEEVKNRYKLIQKIAAWVSGTLFITHTNSKYSK